MMRGASQASLDAVQARFAPVLTEARGKASDVGDQLFVVVDALDASMALRRSLADPSRPVPDKVALVRDLLTKQFDPRTVNVVADLVSERWSHDRDLVDAVGILGIDAYLASAQDRGALETVESELFQITRGFIGHSDVRQALSDSSTDPARRIALIDALFDGKADDVTLAICRRATAVPRGERFVPALVRVGEIAAARRNRLVASVSVGSPLSAAQQARLEGLLESAYGSAVQLNVTVDPTVVGGLRVQIGADVVDATVLGRLADARRRLAS